MDNKLCYIYKYSCIVRKLLNGWSIYKYLPNLDSLNEMFLDFSIEYLGQEYATPLWFEENTSQLIFFNWFSRSSDVLFACQSIILVGKKSHAPFSLLDEMVSLCFFSDNGNNFFRILCFGLWIFSVWFFTHPFKNIIRKILSQDLFLNRFTMQKCE